MPFDNARPVYEVGTLESLVAWLETQDPNTTYCHSSNQYCVFCQWLSAVAGGKAVYDAYHRIMHRAAIRCDDLRVGDYYVNGRRYHLGEEMEMRVARTAPYTFGAALERARVLMGKRHG